MSDTAIFILGGFVTLLVCGGFSFTLLEVRRIDQEDSAKRHSPERIAP